MCSKMSLDLNFTSYAKINSECIIDVNVKHKTSKCFEETIENPHEMGLGKECLEMIPKA